MYIHEAELTDALLETLVALSRDWEAEMSCRGYRANARADIEGNRIFVAEEDARVLGYLFGHISRSERQSSVMPDGTAFFEVEELYVVPERRSGGIGAALFAYAEEAVRADADFMMLSTATKNWRAVFHFYLDVMDMQFWSARLFKRIGAENAAPEDSAAR